MLKLFTSIFPVNIDYENRVIASVARLSQGGGAKYTGNLTILSQFFEISWF